VHVTSEEVMWHYGREQNGMWITLTEAELEPLFFTFVVSAAATSPSTRVLGLVAAALTTGLECN
jgi:hypothetical protein